ncbi:very-long-chain enoyl-CoA reductase [Trichomonascus vanleenenianus]|uniref:trans-2-enoyl-CoA reductase (NADPH) TSC13 n=1 Tax=Trichomonascus vanleenenianus TaxID=2268995 RepID=UPI003ECB616B
MVLLKFKAKGKKIAKLAEEVDIDAGEDVDTLVALIAEDTGKSIHRLRLTVSDSEAKPADKKKKDIVLSPAQKIEYYGLKDGDVVLVKDLGPQISWRTVFFIEYLGPLLIHPVFYFLQKQIYGVRFERSRDQQLVFVFVMLHFLKREYETLFVHKFSMATMPLFNLFKNSGHYWVLSGFFLAYFNYAPVTYFARYQSWIMQFLFSRQCVRLSEGVLYGISFLWLFAELSNFWVHLNLASMRSGDSTERKIPYGYGFNWVSVPNYFFESLSWTAVALISQNWSSWFFLVVATAQMYVWAVKKHQRYLKEFPDYPKDRKIYVPFFH